MKKQSFSNLGRIIGKAVIVAALACPIVLSSCSKLAFDDTELKESIKDLNDRLTALEEKVNNDIATLTQIVNGKVTVLEVTTNNDGSKTVTLSNGDTFTVGANVSGKSLLTVKEENGKSYWAITVDGGEAEFILDGDGKKVPVSVTPDIRINDGLWEISVDGGQSWIETQVESGDIVFYTSFNDDEDYVYLTLADGSIVSIAKNKDVSFAILAGKQYFAYGEKKVIPLEMNEVKDYTITEKPDGWKASISGSKLTVTAPADGVEADSEGIIKVLATFENESPVIAKLNVTLDEADFKLAIDGTDISFTLAAKNVGNMSYSGYVFGILPQSEYSAEAAIEYFNTVFRWGTEYYDDYATTIAELAGESYDPEESYVVFASNWFSPYDDVKYSADDIQYVVYKPVKINVTIVPSLDNAIVAVSFSGCDGFYAGCDAAQYFDPENYLYDLGSDYGPELCTTKYNGPAGLICGGYQQYLQKGTDYVFWVVAYDESGNYSVDSFKTYNFSTKSISLGANLAAPEITISATTFDQVAAYVTPVPGAYKTYAKIFTLDEIPSDELEFVTKITSGSSSATQEQFGVNKTWLDPGTNVIVAAVAIDADGKAGAINRFEASTKAVEFNESLKVTAEAVNVGMTSADIKLTFEGTPAEIKYFCNTYALNDAENTLITDSYTGTKVAVSDLVDNTILLTGLSLASTYYFYVIAYDADGLPSHVATTTFVPSANISYIKQSSDSWGNGKPQISNEIWGDDAWVYRESGVNGADWYQASTMLSVDITLGENCQKVHVVFSTPDDHSTKTELQLSDYVVAYGTELTTSGTASYEYANYATHIYIVWVDSNDEYHTYYEYTPTFPDKPTEPPTSNE